MLCLLSQWQRTYSSNAKSALINLPAASSSLLPLDEAAEADRAKRVNEQFAAVAPGVVQYTTDVLFRDL
jgi:4-carboxymuconolactone decarboxylase